jgi:hypothetical protein
MEFQQIKSLIFDLRLVRWLEEAGLLVSALLYFMYFALAAGYQESWPKNASIPGVNMFEMFAVFHFIAGCCFAVLLILSLFRRTLIRLFLEVPLLLLLALMLFRIYDVSLERWPVWIEEYSKVLFNFSYMDILLLIIVMTLCVRTASEWILHFAQNKTSAS